MIMSIIWNKAEQHEMCGDFFCSARRIGKIMVRGAWRGPGGKCRSASRLSFMPPGIITEQRAGLRWRENISAFEIKVKTAHWRVEIHFQNTSRQMKCIDLLPFFTLSLFLSFSLFPILSPHTVLWLHLRRACTEMYHFLVINLINGWHKSVLWGGDRAKRNLKSMVRGVLDRIEEWCFFPLPALWNAQHLRNPVTRCEMRTETGARARVRQSRGSLIGGLTSQGAHFDWPVPLRWARWMFLFQASTAVGDARLARPLYMQSLSWNFTHRSIHSKLGGPQRYCSKQNHKHHTATSGKQRGRARDFFPHSAVSRLLVL